MNEVISVFVSEIRALIGVPPVGYEWLEYLVVSVILVFLLDSCVTFVSSLFKWIGGR